VTCSTGRRRKRQHLSYAMPTNLNQLPGQPRLMFPHFWAKHVDAAGRWRLRQQHHHASNHAASLCLRTSTSCCWATPALVGTAPCLLCHTPACHPIGKSCVAVIWFRRRHTPTTLVGAALPVDSAAPLLLGHRPTCLPVREPVGAVVGVCWRRWLGRLAADVVHPAAPLLLSLLPREIHADGAIEGIDRPRWGCRPCHRRGGWRSGRWRRWLRRKGCRWHRWRCLRQSRVWATPTNCRTAKTLLRFGPLSLPGRALHAIERQSRRWSREQPAKQRNH